METKKFYHLYANGDYAPNFITSIEDYKAEFNLIGVCAYTSGTAVLAFSIEDSHPHFLLFGTYEDCDQFRILYTNSSYQHILSSRKTKDNTVLSFNMDEITDEDHLRNVGTYVIAQPTKDGKAVMPFDYCWGTGSMYFRCECYTPIWYFDQDGNIQKPVEIGLLKRHEQKAIRCSRNEVPAEWLVCNGLILPSNYVDVKKYESIYRTHNCYRAFLSSGKTKDESIRERMARSSGVVLEDLEARTLAKKLCYELFRQNSARWLNAEQRLRFAMELRKRYRISYRQLSTLSRLPESEIRKYIK